jgi:hypothetical protein
MKTQSQHDRQKEGNLYSLPSYAVTPIESEVSKDEKFDNMWRGPKGVVIRLCILLLIYLVYVVLKIQL